jgi:predicted GNAT family acetyltransferase
VGDTVLRRLTPDDWTVLRDVRLRALTDSPDAFGSTLQREQDFGEKDWRRRSVRPVWVVEVDDRPVAMAGVFPDDGVLQVWGMWTDPEHRGRGHARALLDALVGPAVAEGRPAALHVNVANSGARAFYESYGFVGTGELEPLRPGSEQRIELMRIN